MKNNRTGDNRAAALRWVSPGWPNIAAAEKIRDVGDNVLDAALRRPRAVQARNGRFCARRIRGLAHGVFRR
jgi:hypothetical protein